MDRPSLSVVMPNYNHARFLPEAVESVLNQSYRPTEIVIVDDASTDNSVELLESFAHKEPRIRIYRNTKNLGVIATCNRALEYTSGEYIFSLGSDDKILPGFFEKSMALLMQYPEAGFCFCMSRVIDDQGRDQGIKQLPVNITRPTCFHPDEVRDSLLKHGDWFSGNGVIYRRNAFLEVGGFNVELELYADNFAHHVLALKYGLCFLPEALVAWRNLGTNYFFECQKDLQKYRNMVRRTVNLMETRYRKIIPESYIRHWPRRVFYLRGTVYFQQYREQTSQFHSYLSKLPWQRSLLTILFRFGLRLTAFVHSLLVRFYLYSIYGGLPKGTIQHWIKRLAEKGRRLFRPTLGVPDTNGATEKYLESLTK